MRGNRCLRRCSPCTSPGEALLHLERGSSETRLTRFVEVGKGCLRSRLGRLSLETQGAVHDRHWERGWPQRRSFGGGP